MDSIDSFLRLPKTDRLNWSSLAGRQIDRTSGHCSVVSLLIDGAPNWIPSSCDSRVRRRDCNVGLNYSTASWLFPRAIVLPWSKFRVGVALFSEYIALPDASMYEERITVLFNYLFIYFAYLVLSKWDEMRKRKCVLDNTSTRRRGTHTDCRPTKRPIVGRLDGRINASANCLNVLPIDNQSIANNNFGNTFNKLWSLSTR